MRPLEGVVDGLELVPERDELRRLAAGLCQPVRVQAVWEYMDRDALLPTCAVE